MISTKQMDISILFDDLEKELVPPELTPADKKKIH